MKRLMIFGVSIFCSLNFLLAQQPKLILPIGHTAHLYSAAFSPDGKQVVTASFDHTAKIWDAASGKLLADLVGHREAVEYAEYSPDGKRILTASRDNTVKVWDAVTGFPLTSLRAHTSAVWSAHFSPDGRKIVSASDDSTARVWDAVTGKLLLVLVGHDGGVNYAQFSPDGKKIVTTSEDSTAGVWDAATGKLLAVLSGHEASVATAQFSPDGKKILTASEDKIAAIWDAVSGKPLTLLMGHGEMLRFASFSPDGKKIVTASYDYSAGIWDARTGKLLAGLQGHDGPVETARFSPDGKKIVTASNDMTAKIWDAQSGKLLVTLTGHTKGLYSARFSPDGRFVLTASTDHTAKLWDVASGEIQSDFTGHVQPATMVRYSPDGKKLVMASSDGTAKIWDVPTGRLISVLRGHKGAVRAAQFSPGGEKVLTASADSTAIIWDAVTGKALVIFRGHNAAVRDAAFSPDGKKIVTASQDETVKTWDAATGKSLLDIHGVAATIVFGDDKGGRFHLNYFTSARFSPDGKKIVTATTDAKVAIWDAESGKLILELKKNTLSVAGAQFSPDGKRIAVAGTVGAVKIMDAVSGNELLDLKGHRSSVHSALFSPGGEKIITAGEDSTIKIWDARTGQLLMNLTGHSDAVSYAQFSPDGQRIVSASDDYTCKFWNAQTGECLLSFFGVDREDYFSQVSSGYYQCSPRAARILHYVTRDLKIIGFDQLDVRYNRPDRILDKISHSDTALISSYRKAWEKRIKKLGIDTTAFREGFYVPEHNIVNRDSIGLEQKIPRLTLHIRAGDTEYPLDRFNVWVNEVPVFGQRGIRIRSRKDFDTTVTIVLSQGKNKVESSVTNLNGMESYRMPLLVNNISAATQKPVTHFIGIGIDRFADKKYNLQYSTKDIRDLALRLKEKSGEDMEIDTLFDQQLTAGNVKALKQKLLKSGVNDKVIVAYSGHGLLSRDFDYYLSTYAVKFESPEFNGLPYEELENLLDSIPARKKLMLIDACHSGEVDKEELVRIDRASDSMLLKKGAKPVVYAGSDTHLGMKNSFELMQSLFANVSRSTGANVISAAAGTQFALERGDLMNGVFTYAILEAMDKYVSMKISQLNKIVGERVEQLTNGLQKPTSRNENLAVDWNLW